MPGTRRFFVACLMVSAVIAAIVFAQIIAPQNVPETVAAGYAVWHENGCSGCHTLYGQGGPYAPDLTHIFSARGSDYLVEFMVNPNAFHPGERVMPRFGLTRDETDHLLAFLQWANDHESASDWPPRAIAIRGGSVSVAQISSVASNQSAEDPAVVRGRATFTQRCASCHSLTRDTGGLPGPPLFGIGDRAWHRITGVGAQQYIRESIVDPSAYLVEGYADVMQKNFGEVLTSTDINDLVAFLMTQREPDGEFNLGGGS